MNWDILESYIETLLDMINTRDITVWDAKAKYAAFSKDIRKDYEIIQKERRDEANKN